MVCKSQENEQTGYQVEKHLQDIPGKALLIKTCKRTLKKKANLKMNKRSEQKFIR